MTWPHPRAPTLDEKLDRILAIVEVTQVDIRVLRIALTQVLKLEQTEMATVADVQSALANLTSKEDVALQLLQAEKASIDALTAQLAAAQAASSDPAALDAVVATVNQLAANVDAAVAAVTPAPTP